MYILEPVSHETVWGGQRLKRYAKEKVEKLGHLYLVNGHKSMSNRILNGIHRGKRLSEVFQLEKKSWNLDTYPEFPLTIALVDATENLSIQVHPDDLTAERLEGERIGKTESWLFLDAPSTGWIYDGCCCKTIDEIKRAVEQGRIHEVTKHYPVGKHDYVCVEAGTLHAMTAGSLVYEIEYGSDFTYRFYDYGRRDEHGRKRELHIEKALQAIKPERVSLKRPYEGGWISEQDYEICMEEGLSCYQNSGKEIECISVFGGAGSLDGNSVGAEISLLLMPGERIENVKLERVMIARLRR